MKNNLNIILPLLLISFILVAAKGCKVREVPFEKDFEISLNETVKFADTKMILTYQELAENSLCAPDVQCIRAGQLKINVVINEAQTIELGLQHAKVAQFQTFSIEDRTYMVSIKSFVWPKDKSNDVNKTVVLKMEKVE